MEVMRNAIQHAEERAPFGSEIWTALQMLWELTRQVAGVLTGDVTCLDGKYKTGGIASTHNPVTFRTWAEEPQWVKFRREEEERRRAQDAL